MKFRNVVIFGGTGFIGTHFCRHLLNLDLADKIYLADIKPLTAERLNNSLLNVAIAEGRVIYVSVDVRKQITDIPSIDVDLIANFAAIHREPGHQLKEYFETNILGAENVCLWASNVNCNKIIFTSSISPYGPSETERSEGSLPLPVTPYGSSKLVAEKIHLTWKSSGAGKLLIIVRPGVVFGPGEGGNVTRLVRAVIKRYFFYMGNTETRKAGGYVKELCHSMLWALNQLDEQKREFLLYNFTMDPAPSVREYVETICAVAGIKRYVPHVPYLAMKMVSYPIEMFAMLFNINQPISPVRITKLVKSNNIVPQVFRDLNYKYKFSLLEAMTDWQIEKMEDWK